MSEQRSFEEDFEEYYQFEINSRSEVKKEIDLNPEATLLCEAREDNPNYFAAIYANKKFYQTFSLKDHELFGKSYDFVFFDSDSDLLVDERSDYIALVKAVKNFSPCSLKVSLRKNDFSNKVVMFEIKLVPSYLPEEKIRRAIFVFTEIGFVENAKEEEDILKSSSLRMMERTLRNEMLLREVSNSIISDSSIQDVAKNIAISLCKHLRADRCLLHDYRNGRTNFVSEYCASGDVKAMFKNSKDPESLKVVADYISFQNYFYKKFGKKGEKAL